MTDTANPLTRFKKGILAWTRMAVFTLKVFPMLPSKAIDFVTGKPVIEKVSYPTHSGYAIGDLYRPSGRGRHRGILVCLGVVPFETDHPQVPRLGAALALSGFAALLYWSPAMRDLRLEPDDVENVAMAYKWLLDQPYVDSDRSGLLGTCVGGSFALMASASPQIREHVSFVAAYAPFSSAFTLLQDAASYSTVRTDEREPWQVDQLTRKVFVRSLTAELPLAEAQILREARDIHESQINLKSLSEEGRTIYGLLSRPSAEDAGKALGQLPMAMQDKLSAMSPVNYIQNMRATLVLLLHDRGDSVIPVGESRRLWNILKSRRGAHYTELQFQHLNPGKLPFLRLVRELAKFISALYPLFYY